ncbi:hypothetical protein BGZ73_001290 [Actinomortierella ambigua]|nr:hypothetical protein BGZ73_001290 [Actinomortierella ambigua]
MTTSSSNPLIPPNLLSTSVFHRPTNPARTNSHLGPPADTFAVSGGPATAAANLGGNTEQLSSTRDPVPLAHPVLATTTSSLAAPPTTVTMIKTELVERRIHDTAMTANSPSPPSSALSAVASSVSHGRASTTVTASASGHASSHVSTPSSTVISTASTSFHRSTSHWEGRSERDSTRPRDGRREYSPPRSSYPGSRSSRNDFHRKQGDHRRSQLHHREDHREDYRYSSSTLPSSRNYGYDRTSDRGSLYRPQQQQQRDVAPDYDGPSRDQRRVHPNLPPPHLPPVPTSPSSVSAPLPHSEPADRARQRRSDRTARKRQVRDLSDQSMSESEQTAHSSGAAGRGSTTSVATRRDEDEAAAAAGGGGGSERRREAKRARREPGHANINNNAVVVISPAESPKERSARVASDSATTDDSSTSDSDSDSDSDVSIMGANATSINHTAQVRSVEAVRLQGTIHDLMMQLEKAHSKHRKYAQKAARAVKKIQSCNGRLEKTFRQLNEMNLEQEQRIAEAMQQQQDQVLQLQMKVKELEAAAAAAAASAASSMATNHLNGPTSAAVTIAAADRRVGAVVEDDSHSGSDIELDYGHAPAVHVVASSLEDQQLSSATSGLQRRRSIAGGSTAALAQSASGSASQMSSSLAAQANISLAHRAAEWRNSASTAAAGGRFTLSSKPVVDTLTNLKIDLRSKAFARKPRSLLMYSELSGDTLKDVMVTSSLDGNIQFWDLSSRKMISQLHKNQLQFPWAEDVCWVGKDLLAVASASAQGQPQQRQLSLVHVNASPASGRQGRMTLSSVCQHVDAMPHDKTGINVLAPVDQFSDGSLVLASGGGDKALYQWRFGAPDSEGEYVALEPQLIHSRHTAGVQGLCYSRFDNAMFSGGTDCRLVAWDMQHQSSIIDHRYTDRGRITHILQNPQDPRLFLISHADKTNQLRVMDTRKGAQDTVLTLGFPSVENVSRYVAPSWHPTGGLISCGTTSGTGKIHLWDIRWKNVERGPGQSISVHEKTIFRAAFHPTHSLLASMSSDNTLAFIDFQLNHETVVHNS